jgi:hypothetical protein
MRFREGLFGDFGHSLGIVFDLKTAADFRRIFIVL